MRIVILVPLTELEIQAMALDSSKIRFSVATRRIWMARRRAISKLETAAREVRDAITQGRDE